MKYRLFSIASAISLIACILTVFAWARSYSVMHCWPIVSNKRLIEPTSFDGGIGLKVANNWPLWSSSNVIRIWPGGTPASRMATMFFPGGVTSENQLLGFRLIRGNDLFMLGGSAPTVVPGTVVMAPYWIFVLIFSVLPVRFAWVRRRRRLRSARGLCQKCGYDLRASADRCPECGSAIANEAASCP